MADEFTEFFNKQMQDPEFKKIHDSLEVDYDIIQFLIGTKLSTQEIAEKTGLSKNTVLKIQMADANPSLKTLKQIAESFGQKLRIQFVPV